MNPALLYLSATLLKGRARQFVRNLRRPTTATGFASVVLAFGVLFHFRRASGFGDVVRPQVLVGACLAMLGGSFFKGFLQHGLVFELADVEFVFTSPFSKQQVLFYQLLPGYLYALAQSAAFFVLFESHLTHPVIVSLSLLLLQIACFHIATGAAIFAGSISDQAHHRLKWMLLFFYFMIAALYLRKAWDLRLVPAFMNSPLAQGFFYPAAPLLDIGTCPFVGRWSTCLANHEFAGTGDLLPPLAYLFLFGIATLTTLASVLRLNADIFEPSLATTTALEERRSRLRQGRSAAAAGEHGSRSLALPKVLLFRGGGAIVWKNLAVALRSRRQLLLAATFTSIYTGFLLALRWILHRELADGGELMASELRDFDKGIAGMLAALVFFLQRAFPFDLRRDGQHLVQFRTLPVSPLMLVLAELAVPTLLCLLFQAGGIAVLFLFAQVDLRMALLVLLAFPAVALALNAVWNLHYLLAALRRAGNRTESAGPVTMVMVVALSFLVFYPAGWLAIEVGRHTFGPSSEVIATMAWLAVQYSVDVLLVLLLANLFQRFEVARDS
jgi:hypothetical protein